jgi:hypothetical protein
MTGEMHVRCQREDIENATRVGGPFVVLSKEAESDQVSLTIRPKKNKHGLNGLSGFRE